jgi:glycyl-tRNA synthetase beta chain
MLKPLLIEIGVEELPAIPFLRELPNIESKWRKVLKSQELECAFKFYYTPRRLVLWHPEFPSYQPTRVEEFFGAPVEIAFKDGKPTPAALGFAKKCQVDVSELKESERNGKKVLYYQKEIEGSASIELLKDMVKTWLESLSFGKSMRWGSLKESFIRPIRSIAILLGDEALECEIFGVKSSPKFYPHRTVSYEPISFSHANDYFDKLKEGGVVLYPNERKEIILNQMETLEKQEGITIQKDLDLLAEVVAITEHPKALLGSFDEKFLVLPPEVIITSMKEHQRYFPVFLDGKLTNRFVVVSNAIADDYKLIVSGNEKVLRARLEDALFFWENDLKNGLSSEGLKDIVYLEGLGSLYDKVQREQKIGAYLAKKYLSRLKSEQPKKDNEQILALLDRTIGLCKADLLSEMVYEFTELQGVMGYYYAKQSGQDEALALAFKEQYLPDSEDSDLPSTYFSAIVALSYKIDSLLALFSIGKIPTGTKDPFALRRAVSGIVKIVLAFNLPFDIKADFAKLAKEYKEFDLSLLENFFIERLYSIFDANPSIIHAVLQSKERDLLELSSKISALKELSQSKDFKNEFATFKRVANIVKNVELDSLHVKPELFEDEHEKALWEAFLECDSKEYKNYLDRLNALFGLRGQINAFFDNVMVNTDNLQVRQNRHHLIASIYRAFLKVADIKEIGV